MGIAVRSTLCCFVLLLCHSAPILAQGQQPITIFSRKPAANWEQALLGGNGNQGVMVIGRTHDETIVINHSQCWVPAQPVMPDLPDCVESFRRARKTASSGDVRTASHELYMGYKQGNEKLFPTEALIRSGSRLGLNYVHPAAHLKLKSNGHGNARDYRRSLTFDSGEIVTQWTDDVGKWQRRCFVSRVDDVTVVQLKNPDGRSIDCSIQLAQRQGYDEKDIANASASVEKDELYLKTYYRQLHGLNEPDGYHTMMRVIAKDGKQSVSKSSVQITGASEVLLLLRTEFLPIYSQADRNALRKSLDSIPADYDRLLEKHARVHGELFNRVRFELGGKFGDGRSTEEILAESVATGPTPAFLELIHASGRYCLISSSGKLPPTLMGVWGDTWKPNWWGHYTLDSNLQLAVSYGNVGNLPESMEGFFSWIETLYGDWELNATRLYGARGYMGAISHGWRHGKVIAGWNAWTGCSAWMATFFWQHYLFTGDKEFLANRVVPLLENVALFYEDFLNGSEDETGKYFVYPSISPENTPAEPKIKVQPNSTSELALIRETFGALIESYQILGIKQDRIPKLKSILAKVPPYRINEDGTLAEWSYPGTVDNYNHRHNSHLIALYPGVSISPDTPKLYEAARIAIAKRRQAGQGNKSAHGYMELGFVGARLQDPEIVWKMLDDYAKQQFIHPSFISSHNPDLRIYNLDSILALPAIFSEMCLYSRPGTLNLLPGIPLDKLPSGKIEGILARTGIVVQRLSWDAGTGKILLTLKSKTNQSVSLTSRLKINSVEGADVESLDAGGFQVRLKAGEPRELTVNFDE